MEKIGIIKSKRVTLSQKTSAKNLNSHFWFSEKGESYMFKYATNDEYHGRSFLNEALISQMCRFIGLPCQDAKIARYIYGNVDGVKIKSFLRQGEREISLQDIIDENSSLILDAEFGENFLERYIYPFIPTTKKETIKLKKSKLQTSTGLEPVNGKFPTKISLEDIWCNQQNKIKLLFDIYLEKDSPAVKQLFDPKVINSICNKIILINKINTYYNETQSFDSLMTLITDYAEMYNYTIAPELKEQLTKMLIFDYVVRQTDRHLGNISLILNDKTLRLAPLYDNGHCLMFNYNFIPHENNHFFHTRITPEILNTSVAKKTIASIKDFLNNHYDEFVQQLLENSRDLLEFAPHNKNLNEKKFASNKLLNRQHSKTQSNFTRAIFSKFSSSGQHNANCPAISKDDKTVISGNINGIKNEDSFLALNDDQIKHILHADIIWLNNNGIKYSPELWFKTYLYCNKQIMKDYLGQLLFYSEKTKNNKFDNLFQK